MGGIEVVLAVASAAAQAGGQVASNQAQAKAARSRNRSLERAFASNRARLEVQADDQRGEVARQAAALRDRISANAAARGVSNSASVAATQNQAGLMAARDTEAVNYNLGGQLDQLRSQTLAGQARPVFGSALTAGFQGGLSGYQTALSLESMSSQISLQNQQLADLRAQGAT